MIRGNHTISYAPYGIIHSPYCPFYITYCTCHACHNAYYRYRYALGVRNHDFDQYLGAYPLKTHGRWQNLTSNIDSLVLQKVTHISFSHPPSSTSPKTAATANAMNNDGHDNGSGDSNNDDADDGIVIEVVSDKVRANGENDHNEQKGTDVSPSSLPSSLPSSYSSVMIAYSPLPSLAEVVQFTTARGRKEKSGTIKKQEKTSGGGDGDNSIEINRDTAGVGASPEQVTAFNMDKTSSLQCYHDMNYTATSVLMHMRTPPSSSLPSSQSSSLPSPPPSASSPSPRAISLFRMLKRKIEAIELGSRSPSSARTHPSHRQERTLQQLKVLLKTVNTYRTQARSRGAGEKGVRALNLPEGRGFLGEMQHAFVRFLVGQCYDGLEQWKSMIRFVCSCETLFETETGKPPMCFIPTTCMCKQLKLCFYTHILTVWMHVYSCIGDMYILIPRIPCVENIIFLLLCVRVFHFCNTHIT